MSSALTPGTKLGRYEIHSLLGAGGMGEVYRARDPQLGRDVAIKVLPPAFAADAERLRRFEQEARAAGTLNHPNILAIYDIGSREGSPYVVAELLEGDTLRDEIARGALPQRKALDYARQIAEGLAAAHEKGVVHRDLKPENLFVTKDGRVKILDFGLAKLAQAKTSGAVPTQAPTVTYGPVTEPGILLGTVGYMSPEQARGEPADHRADIFSFGVVLYEMLTGQRAFQRGSAVETLGAILRDEPPELSESSPRMGLAIARLLRHCLEKRPEARFQSARDLAFALDSLSTPSLEIPSSPTVGLGRSKLRRRDVIAGGAVMAATGALGLFTGRRMAGRSGAAQPDLQRLTFRQGAIHSARFAPEGPAIIYSALWEGEALQLFSTRPDNPESRPLGLPDANVLAISPAGEMALMLRPSRPTYFRTGTLARMPMAGGAPREVLDNVIDADWSPDGSQLAVVRAAPEAFKLEFPTGRTLFESAVWIRHPRISPNGEQIAFVDTYRSVVVADLSGGTKVLSIPQATQGEVTGLAWSPLGDEVWFSQTESGEFSTVRGLYAVSTSGRKRLVWRGVGLNIRDIARDGRALFTVETLRFGISCLPPGEERERDLSWLHFSVVADISSDGKTLLFEESALPSGPAVYLRGTNGSPAVQIGQGNVQTLSPDGRWALSIQAISELDPTRQELLGTPGQKRRLILLPTGAGESRRLTDDTIDVFMARWFPDSRRVAIGGAEVGELIRVHVLDLEGGRRRAVTPEGYGLALPGVDPGGALVAVDGEGGFRLFPVEGGEPRPVLGLGPDEYPIQWGSDGVRCMCAGDL